MYVCLYIKKHALRAAVFRYICTTCAAIVNLEYTSNYIHHASDLRPFVSNVYFILKQISFSDWMAERTIRIPRKDRE